MDVLTATIEGLLLGHPLDRDAWLQLASRLSQGRSVEEDAMLALARIATVSDKGSIGAILETIPGANKPARAIGEALAASRSVDTTDPRSLSQLVFVTHQLLPYLRDRSHVEPALRRLAELQTHAIEIGGEPLDLAAASVLTSLSNTLSMGLGNQAYLDAAFALAGRLHHLPAHAAHEQREGLYLVMSNLVTTCKQLAAHRPTEAAQYLLRGVELASSLYESRGEMARLFQDPQLALHTVVQALGNLIFIHVELVRVSPTRSAHHVAAAWRHAAQLQELADEQGDPDLRREASKAEEFLLDRVGPLPGSLPRSDKPSLGSVEELFKSFNAMSRTSWVAAQHVRQLHADAERHRAITDHIDALYGGLAQSLEVAIQEVGINRHISRVFLALGALASGRLWPLSLPAVDACLLGAPPPEEGESHWHRTERAQEMASRRFFELSSSYAGHVCALAVFSDTLSSEDGLPEMLRTVLRERNRELLKHVVPAGQPRHVPGRRLSKIEDVAEIMTLVQSFGACGRSATPPAAPSVTPVSEREHECPCGSGEPFRRCHGDDEGGAEPAPAGVGIAEAATAEPAGVPPRSLLIDPEPDGSKRTIVDPQDMIGVTLRESGEAWFVDSIVGMGTQKVIFGLTNIQTGDQRCMAMSRLSFGPKARLAEYLERVGPGQQGYDHEKMIGLCDSVLARHPHDWTAGFNKGTALLIKEDFVAAIDAFDTTLIGSPDDLYALVYKAYALVHLGRHSVAVTHLVRAARLYPEGLNELLRDRQGLKGELSASTLEVLREAPDRDDARQLLREHFS